MAARIEVDKLKEDKFQVRVLQALSEGKKDRPAGTDQAIIRVPIVAGAEGIDPAEI